MVLPVVAVDRCCLFPIPAAVVVAEFGFSAVALSFSGLAAGRRAAGRGLRLAVCGDWIVAVAAILRRDVRAAASIGAEFERWRFCAVRAFCF